VSLIEGLAARGECDFLTDFAQTFPTVIFMGLMGLPVERTREFIDRAQVVLRETGESDPDFARRGAAAMQIVGDIAAAAEAHKAEPRDDIITRLLRSAIDDRPLSAEELYQLGFLLYLAGLDTVANVLTYSFRYLAANPGLRATLTASPELIPDAVEEFLRFFSIATTVRVVTRDAEFAGCPMKTGDRIVLPTASAARDAAQFAEPEVFRPDRMPNPHLAFGAGPHRCPGSHLARLELRIALEEWHRMIPDYEITDDAGIREHVGPVAGLTTLPLRWPPAHP
jgi:cytochrome P450